MDESVFFVGAWEVNPRAGAISDGQKSARLEPRAMEVLVYLASRPDMVVSREELEREVWRGALVGYDAVTSTVIKLRKALGDSARQPEFIATVPKRGYRLIAEVRTDTADGSSLPAASADNSPMGRLKAQTWLRSLGIAIALIVVFLTYWLHRPAEETTEETASAAAPPSIIVLPFENLGDVRDTDAFADGVTEDIITDLSGLGGLRVIASNTAFTFKGKSVTAETLGAELGIDYVLDGSIRRIGDQVRVNAQLVDAQTGFQRWAERYDREVSEVFALQDKITSSIVTALALKLSNRETERLAQQATNNLDAYDHFQEGQRLVKISTRETHLQAQSAYRRAIEADPGYGRAYGALAFTLASSYRRGWSDMPMQTLDRALELAKKAVALDGAVPQTYWALGYVHLMRREYDQAEFAVRQAIDIAPNYADGYGLLALISNGLGKSEAAIEFINRATELNPYYSWTYPYNLGRAYYALGRTQDAIIQFEKARMRNQNGVPIRLHLAASYVQAGRLSDAEWEIEEVQALSPTDTLSHLRNSLPVKDPVLLNRILDDLRTAGLPE
jgi:TolB-like protein/DNA-binding winged helix-turn-helix (wHTH) protein/Tfp pilus assembly protein PilF